MTWLELGERLGRSSGFMSKVAHGTKLPAVDHIETWADALRLTGEVRDDFIRSAHLAHATTWLNDHLEHVEEKFDVVSTLAEGLYELIAEHPDRELQLKAKALWEQAFTNHLSGL